MPATRSQTVRDLRYKGQRSSMGAPLSHKAKGRGKKPRVNKKYNHKQEVALELEEFLDDKTHLESIPEVEEVEEVVEVVEVNPAVAAVVQENTTVNKDLGQGSVREYLVCGQNPNLFLSHLLETQEDIWLPAEWETCRAEVFEAVEQLRDYYITYDGLHSKKSMPIILLDPGNGADPLPESLYVWTYNGFKFGVKSHPFMEEETNAFLKEKFLSRNATNLFHAATANAVDVDLLKCSEGYTKAHNYAADFIQYTYYQGKLEGLHTVSLPPDCICMQFQQAICYLLARYVFKYINVGHNCFTRGLGYCGP